jgi:hypothetical protein
MSRFSRIRLWHYVAVLAVLGLWYTCPTMTRAAQARADQPARPLLDDDDDAKKDPKKGPKVKKGAKGDKKTKHAAKGPKIRWGQQRSESDAEYDKRFATLLKRVKKEKQGDYSGGQFFNEKDEEVRFWTHRSGVFICRSDISQEFTADLVMYMEMLHREYGEAFQKTLGVPSRVREPIEVIVFGNRITYIKAGNPPGSGGNFNFCPNLMGDRSPFWPAKHFRLTQFTDGVTDFAKWEKGVLKHEAAHMELQLRLGFTIVSAGNAFGLPEGIAFAAMPPIWYTEGVATVFEHWDFNKTVDENFLEIPNRGRYAPFIRRLYGTDEWQDFDTLWHLNMRTWNQGNVYINYCYAWSLMAYMFTEGKNGHRDFRKIMDLTKSVGENTRKITSNMEVVESNAWNRLFPEEDRAKLEANWMKWVAENVPRDKQVPDEEFLLRRMGIKPDVIDRIERFSTDAEIAANKEWVEKETERRKNSKTVEW